MRPIFYSVLTALLLAVVAVGAAFMRWRRQSMGRLLGGTLAQTARGPIDCAFAGPDEAPVVLVLHGGLGGWDQGMAIAEDLDLPATFRVIAPSRPGYLQTPLSVGKTTDEAADAMIALLDAQNVATAFVVGLSGGGPTAVAMAARHPHRVRALVMVCAISCHHVQPAITTETLFGRLLFSNAGGWLLDLVSWLALQLFGIAPAFMTRYILHMTELASRRDTRGRVRELRKTPERMRWVGRLLEHSFPISPRQVGLSNDLVQFASLGLQIDARITCPVLVIHGRIDGNVPIAHAEAVISAADRPESLLIDDASHLLWLHPRIDEVRTRLLRFLRLSEMACRVHDLISKRGHQ
ncbi:MAG: alpha/beta hydrolase [Phycisphaerales bacterium]|nr:alpha/beta hydrolase [Phycisphaerales bacterium]MCI0629887.1 alpha/beta hydrolase [Phycisphaerales bacterium]MCI0675312.1 alpha/beta hydrolase [Phycisphaerales bacterium]